MVQSSWIKDAVFYHIYPLGLCGAPEHNDFNQPVVNRLDALYPWLDHIRNLGANALYLGPVFQSSTHGYDTVDYYQIDRRLGDKAGFSAFADAVHQRGIRLVLDAVFNHVGREFWAFRDVQRHGEQSAYVDWFHNLRFGETNPHGDPFQYEGWQGHTSLVKLNLANPDVRGHLFDAAGQWMDDYAIDGLRLDAADCLDLDFLRALRAFTHARQPDLWLMGEVVHGDYRHWANPETLDSVTNYSAYKGLYSSLVDANYFEIAHTLNRQFGGEGRYRDLWLYNFVDNHDVNRVASQLPDPALLYPLYILLLTMPGIPSIYYGSEGGVMGVKGAWTDAPLRPSLDLNLLRTDSPQRDLSGVIRHLIEIRSALPALKVGDYQELAVSPQQFAFMRQVDDQQALILLNSAGQPASIEFSHPEINGSLQDVLNQNEEILVENGKAQISIPPTWGRILVQNNIKI